MRSLGRTADLLWRQLFEERDHGVDVGLCKRHHDHLFIVGYVDLPDDGFHPANVLRVIRQDYHVRIVYRGDVAVLRDERAQYLDQFAGLDVCGWDDSGDHFLTSKITVEVRRIGTLLRERLLDDLYDIAGRDCCEAMYAQDGKEQFVHAFFVQRGRGNHGDAPLDPRIHHEVASGDARYLADELADVRIFQVDAVVRRVVLRGRGGRDARERQDQDQNELGGANHGVPPGLRTRRQRIRVVTKKRRSPRWISRRAEPASMIESICARSCWMLPTDCPFTESTTSPGRSPT